MSIDLFIIMSLATWRLASMFANESGPFRCFERFRKICFRLCKQFWICDEFQLYELITCEWCNSVWFGAAFYLLYVYNKEISFAVSLPLALSAVTIIIKLFVIHPAWLEKKEKE